EPVGPSLRDQLVPHLVVVPGPVPLPHVAEPPPHGGRLAQHVVAGHPGRPGGGQQQRGEDPQARGLPGPVGAEERDQLARGDVDAHPLQRLDRPRSGPVRLAQLSRLYHAASFACPHPRSRRPNARRRSASSAAPPRGPYSVRYAVRFAQGGVRLPGRRREMASSRKVDDVRLLRLLWRGAEEPSARSGLTVGRIVDAGVRVADAEGLEAVSMRRVAAELKVGAMSLYTYVPGKEELVYLMFDQVYGELDVERSREGSWRQRFEAFARAHWDLLHAHPCLLDVPLRRPVVGPNAPVLFAYQLSIVDGIGLDPLEMNVTLDLV